MKKSKDYLIAHAFHIDVCLIHVLKTAILITFFLAAYG